MYSIPKTPHGHLDTERVCQDIARLFGKGDDALNAPYADRTTVYFELQGIVRGLMDYSRLCALREND